MANSTAGEMVVAAASTVAVRRRSSMPEDHAVPGANTMTILFTDLVGSTAMGDRLGDDRAQAVRRQFFAIIEEAVAPTGGRVVKTLGDGHMVAFVSALDAVGCAIAIQAGVDAHNSEPDAVPLGVRVGINAGDVYVEGEDLFGTPVTIAKRLCDSAAGGQILISGLVESLVGSRGSFSFKAVGQLELRGLSRPQSASEVIWRRTDSASPAPAGPARWWVRRRLLGEVGAALAIVVAAGAAAYAITGGDDAEDERAARPSAEQASVAATVLLDQAGEVPTAAQSRVHTFVGATDQVVSVQVQRRRADVDLMVELRGPDGELLAFDDDGGEGSEPLVGPTRLPADGTYSVVVHMLAPRDNGPYAVRVLRLADQTALVAGSFVELGAGEVYTEPFDFRAGEEVTVTVTSDPAEHADLVAELLDPEGEVVARDDDSGVDSDPVLRQVQVATSGTWQVRLSAVEAADTGAFHLVVEH